MADLTKDRLNDPFRIPRASRYASPWDAGDALPIVYGDLTAVLSPGRGAYAFPQIDTAGGGAPPRAPRSTRRERAPGASRATRSTGASSSSTRTARSAPGTTP